MTALSANLDPQICASTPEESLEAMKIRAAQNGDLAAFEWLVRQHEDRLFTFCCRWLHCPQDAREVGQDAFVRAWQALPEFEGRSRFSTWLYQIALNLCRDRSRTRHTRQQSQTVGLDAIEDCPRCPQPSPDQNAEWQGEMRKLERGLAALPEKLRAALMLTTQEGLSQDECAQVLNCSVRSVEGRVYRARQMLLQWWNRQA